MNTQLRHSRQKTYVLKYKENEAGCGKRVELECSSFVEIYTMLKQDPAKREVEVYQGGQLRCHVAHAYGGLRVRRARQPSHAGEVGLSYTQNMQITR